MKAPFRILIIMLTMTLMFMGCQWDFAPTDPLSYLDIPETGYEECFSAVVSAVLFVGDTQQQIQPEDPRLLRVLNAIGYAIETRQYVHTQGVIQEDEIKQYYSSGATMLEITFAADTESSSSFLQSPKILISGDTYLLYMKNGTCAEVHRPYYEQAPEGAMRSESVTDWGGEYWLDILEYCGF